MISIIIPLFNERDNIIHYNTDLFPVIEDIAKKYHEEVEFIFVDDGSKDDTIKKIQEIADIRSNIRIAQHGTNKGMGNAIKTGLALCKGELVITMDADLTFRPVDVEKLLAKFTETHADCISGSPYLENGLMEEVTPFRLLMSKSVNFLYRVLLGSKITCVSPIFRLYRTKLLRDLNITSNNFEINAEIISKLLIIGKTVVEVPVPLLKRKYGTSKINVRKEIANYMRLMWKIFKTKYLHKEWK